MLVHNHPAGNLQPSTEDIDITDKLIQIGRFHKCFVLDHLIINPHSYYSFSDSGLIAKLNNSSKFAPSFLYEKWQAKRMEKLKREAEREKKLFGKKREQLGEKRGEEKGVQARNKEIARQMLLDKEPLEKIKKWTGLTHQWLGRLKSEIERERKIKEISDGDLLNGKKRK